jgi:hypothetical protein
MCSACFSALSRAYELKHTSALAERVFEAACPQRPTLLLLTGDADTYCAECVADLIRHLADEPGLPILF